MNSLGIFCINWRKWWNWNWIFKDFGDINDCFFYKNLDESIGILHWVFKMENASHKLLFNIGNVYRLGEKKINTIVHVPSLCSVR